MLLVCYQTKSIKKGRALDDRIFKEWKRNKDKITKGKLKKDLEFMEWSNQDMLKRLKERQRHCANLLKALSKNSIRANMKPVPDPVEFKAAYEELQRKNPLAVGLGSPVFVAMQKKMEQRRQEKLQSISEQIATPTPTHTRGRAHFNDNSSADH